jgi:hypothetical protein
MTKQEQEKIELNLQFIACGQMRGNMYWVRDPRKQYIFAVNRERTSKVVYGGIFLMKDYDLHKHKIHAYYNNSMVYSGETLDVNLYDFTDVLVRPIKISSISDVITNRYSIGKEIECGCFVGNKSNRRMNYNSTKGKRYYKVKRIDKENFIQMIKDRKGE